MPDEPPKPAENIFRFPGQQLAPAGFGDELTAEEKERRYRAEQAKLMEDAKRAVIERQAQDRLRIAEQRLELGRNKLEEQKAERERKTAVQEWREQRDSERAAAKKAKEKSQTFADIRQLPPDQQDSKLEELAEKLEEETAALKAEFADYCAAKTASEIERYSSEWDVERWPDPVTTVQVLEALVICLSKHVIAKPYQILAIALWIMLAWVHEKVCHYSPYLVLTSPKPGCGKTTLLVDVIKHLVPRPFVGSGHTPANIYRTADRDKPTMLFDNINKLLREIEELFEFGYTRGVKVPRQEWIAGELVTRLFDPHCAKAVTLIGTNVPEAFVSRCHLIELWPKKKNEHVPAKPFEQAVLDELTNQCRMLARWSDDHAEALKKARPAVPASFFNRSSDNWTVMWAIADLAGANWAEDARHAAEQLSQEELAEPSWLDRLLKELFVIFVEERQQYITSAKLVARLIKDPTSPWRNYGRGHPVNQWDIGVLLRGKLRIHSELVGKSRLGGYTGKQFLENEIFERFLGWEPAEPLDLSSPKPAIKRRKKTAPKKRKLVRKRTKPRRRRK